MPGIDSATKLLSLGSNNKMQPIDQQIRSPALNAFIYQ